MEHHRSSYMVQTLLMVDGQSWQDAETSDETVQGRGQVEMRRTKTL